MPTRDAGSIGLSKSDYELLAEFRYVLRKFLGFSERAANQHGVTPQQYQVLLAIEGYPGRNRVTVGELAEQMQVAHHSAVGLVDRMVKLQLVERVRSEQDRRRVWVQLTAEGKQVLDKLYHVHRGELQSVGPQLVALLQRASGYRAGGLWGVRNECEEGGLPRTTLASPVCYLPEFDEEFQSSR